MGTFRFVLAMAVLISHVATTMDHSIVNRESLHILVWSGNAVVAFFIISGFYMSLIIDTKYGNLPNGTQRFYLNRALRLYPTQWLMLLSYAALYAATKTPSFLLGDLRVPFWRWLYAMFSNTFFFGAEVLPFFDKGNWAYVIGPIWSLSIELYFYLLAPFIVMRRLRTILTFAFIALAFRLALYVSNVPMLPWRYFFFPANLVFFLLGSISYRLYANLKAWRGMTWVGGGAAILLFGSIMFPPLWTAPDLDQPLSWAFYLIVMISTPFLFSLTANSRIDNFVGQLSYPIYLSHMLVISAVLHIYTFQLDKGLVATVLTLAFSTMLYLFLDRPIEIIRSRIGSNKHLAR